MVVSQQKKVVDPYSSLFFSSKSEINLKLKLIYLNVFAIVSWQLIYCLMSAGTRASLDVSEKTFSECYRLEGVVS